MTITDAHGRDLDVHHGIDLFTGESWVYVGELQLDPGEACRLAGAVLEAVDHLGDEPHNEGDHP